MSLSSVASSDIPGVLEHDPALCNIKVVCRIRPLNDAEERTGSQFVIKNITDDALMCGGKPFNFDRVFHPKSAQAKVYAETARQIVVDVLSGYNGTIFAYGQTSSGKTHTMEGVLGDPDNQGIIPRIVQDIFSHIYSMDENLEFHIKVSYFEIYMDKIRDLLDVSKSNLVVHEDKNRVPYVKGVTERFVSSPEEVMDVIDEGKENRHVSVTNMNEHSSRSHSVFLIDVRQENLKTQKKLSGKLYLVDLAGSEKVSKTGAEGSTLDEAKNINKSLSALGNVIAALAEGTKSHVPYRDSKLTRILQESLGGNARTTIITCVSPASYNESETKSTLLFGQRAKTIKNTVVVNEELTAEEWRRLYEKERDKASKLRLYVSKLETELNRWRAGEKVGKEEQLSLGQLAALMSASTTSLPEVASTPPSQTASLPSLENAAKLAEKGTAEAQKEVTAKDKDAFEKERADLYRQLDEKDDELSAQSENLNMLKEQLLEKQQELLRLRRDMDVQQMDLLRVNKENDLSKSELKEVMQALEELYLSFDQKKTEVESKIAEVDQLSEENSKNRNSLAQAQLELQQAHEISQIQKRRTVEMLSNMSTEMADISSILASCSVGSSFKMPIPQPLDMAVKNEKLDEEFMVTKLSMSRLKSDIRNLVQKLGQVESSNADSAKKLEDLEKELSETSLRLGQSDAKLKSVQESLRVNEDKKFQLEQQLDGLNEELTRLQAQEQLKTHQSADHQASAVEMQVREAELKKAVDAQMQLQREQHHKQVTALREEIHQKEAALEQLRDANEKTALAKEQLQKEFDKLKTEEAEKSARLQEFINQRDLTEQAKQDLKGMEEAVTKELQQLYNLRRLFVDELQNRMKKSQLQQAQQLLNQQQQQQNKENQPKNVLAELEEDELEAGGSLAQRQKVAFLENNLEQLTRIHKQLVRDNADLRCEIPKLEKRMRSTMERVKTLETALKEAREVAVKDRQRYMYEVERIKEAVRQKNIQRRAHQPQIAKAIRGGGQAPSASGAMAPISSNSPLMGGMGSSSSMGIPSDAVPKMSKMSDAEIAAGLKNRGPVQPSSSSGSLKNQERTPLIPKQEPHK
ncbi:kinesin heavy chain-like [Paramacrobiotus metropolitanus]|uniref:kinesin heavy chain-like n=1 Tax=Paramacrobiotus metropolitanus TaxID=2943436 RepID=UPI0024463BBB|nr:kinesin heavy chain-like [Paramacrobiotus metropolitanus]